MSPEERARYGLLIVVRRGDTDLYARFMEDFVSPGMRTPIEIVWDRRHGERRVGEHPVSVDRRRASRRQREPDTWREFGFVLVAVRR